MPAPRNPFVRAAILRKGGAHVRARSGERADARRTLDTALAEWDEERLETAGEEPPPRGARRGPGKSI